jgi:acetyltransferase-like isoleucine patch superfamily enzyme
MDKVPSPIARFSKKYQGRLLHILAEEYLGFISRHIPGMEGILLRRLVYGRLLENLGKTSPIYPGVFFTHTYGISAGDNFAVNTGAHLDGRGGIEIGNGVMIGPNVVIVSSTHQFDRTDVPMTSLDHLMQRVRISDDVWIGAQAVIRGGVTIGRGVVLGAGSIVLKDAPDYAVMGGNPARVLKIRVKNANL